MVHLFRSEDETTPARPPTINMMTVALLRNEGNFIDYPPWRFCTDSPSNGPAGTSPAGLLCDQDIINQP